MSTHTDEQGTGTPAASPDGPEPSSAPTERRSLGRAFMDLIEPFNALAETSRSLLGVYISYLLEGLVYFGILTILGKYLSENVGLKDLHAGWVYSLFTGGITLAMLFMGGISDKIGIRRALLISLSLLALGRLFLGASSAFFAQGHGAASAMFIMVAVGLSIVVVGYGMYQPASYAAVKQFTDGKQATMAYAMIYGLMNLGSFFSGAISPFVRHSFGIGAVYWVYFALVVLALVLLQVIMTNRVVRRDTRTDISAKATIPKVGETAAAPHARLLTPSFLALIAGVIAALGIVIALALSDAPGPAEKPLDIAKRELSTAASLLGEMQGDPKDKKGRERDEKLSKGLFKTQRALQMAYSKVVPPAKPSRGTQVDRETFQFVRALLKTDGVLLRAVAENPATLRIPVTVGSQPTTMMRRDLRAMGVYYLAVAYRLAGNIDRRVLVRIQQRMSTPHEKYIPVPDGAVKRILETTQHDTSTMLARLAGDTDELALRADHALGAGGGVLVQILRAESGLLKKVVETAGDRWRLSLTELLIQHCFQFGTFLIDGAAPPLFEGVAWLRGKREHSVPVSPSILVARIASDEALVEHLKVAADAAVRAPLAERLQRWSLRYGILLFVIVFFTGFAVAVLLKKRPDHPFHDGRFVFFIFVLIPVQTLFAHNWLTLPYYIDRAFGGTYVGRNFEFFSNINPVLIFLITPFVAALTARRQVYNMMILGTFVMATPTFLLVAPPSPMLLLVYILLMSIGEAMWQPRFLQWVAEIAPEGKTGAYMGIAQFPWFLTKVLTGLYSGYFLSKYCPLVGPQNTETLWLLYALIAMVSPITLVLARGWMQKAMRGQANA